jgi:hypothetical protein
VFVAFRGERSTNLVYVAVAVFIIILIILTILFTSNQLTQAYVSHEYLSNGWIDSGERDSEEGFLGLEKQASFKYIVDENYDDRYPAFLTVSSIKTLFLMNEEELLSKTIETINLAADERSIVIEENSKIEGNRVINNSHETYFVKFNGTDMSEDISEDIKIIGETWNCAFSGTSVICIGVAQITDNSHNNSVENLTHWNEIIAKNGLIYNVNCHD